MSTSASTSKPFTVARSGFSLNAAVSCQAHQRSKLERLSRYVARPPLALERLSVTDEGKPHYAHNRPYSNGTPHFLFEPLDILAKLAALVPRPRVNLTRYHEVFAPNSKLRTQRVKRALEFDVAVCPLCVGTLRVSSDITEPALIDKVLTHIKQTRAPPAQ